MLTVATTTTIVTYTPFSGYQDASSTVTTYLTLNGSLVGAYTYQKGNEASTGKLTYLHTNYLGTPVLETDDKGDIVQMDITDVFGNYVMRDQRKDNAYHNKGYTSHEFDDVSGLTYAKARYMDTKMHSFLSVDPLNYSLPQNYLLDPQQMNSYAYARNNPTVYTDPDGQSAKTYFQGAGAQLWQDAPGLIGGVVIGAGLVAAGVASAPVVVAAGIGLTLYGAGSSLYNGYQAYQAYNSGSIDADTRDYYLGRSTTGLGEAAVGSYSAFKGLSSGSKLTKAEQLSLNRQNGDSWENKVADDASSYLTDMSRQLMVKTNTGVRTKIDIAGKDANGNICLIECKSSQTASFTPNQKRAIPQIAKSGGVVVSSNKSVPKGTIIPPTKVNIVIKR